MGNQGIGSIAATRTGSKGSLQFALARYLAPDHFEVADDLEQYTDDPKATQNRKQSDTVLHFEIKVFLPG